MGRKEDTIRCPAWTASATSKASRCAPLAHRAAIHRTYLSDIERGTRNVSLVNIELLARALDLPMSDLFRAVERE